MNFGVIIGRLTRDMELSYSKENKPYGKGSIAVNDRFKKDKTHFFNFVAFGNTAKTMSKYLSKGSQVGLEYSLSQSSWQDKNGENKSRVELVVNNFTFCDSKKPSSGNNQQVGEPQNEPIFENNDFEGSGEIPF